MSLLRLYTEDELGRDGYPPEWHNIPGMLPPPDEYGLTPPFGIKHIVRADAGHRCVRCLHPYAVGRTAPEWSPCDERCEHSGPMRVWTQLGGGEEGWTPFNPTREACGPAIVAVAPAAVEAQWRVLTVHHLDMDKANCRWWNLCALCQRCHLQIQGKVQMARVWPWEHTTWFQPYVAGYYAHVYLGEDLTRVEAEARQDELLALERTA